MADVVEDSAPADAGELEADERRAMFERLGWSTTSAPGSAAAVDEPAYSSDPAVHRHGDDLSGAELEEGERAAGDVWSPKVDAVPRNAVTGAAYRGGNVVRLLAAEAEHGYRSGAGWAGFGQWRSVGRVVRKGEHGTACIAVTSGGKQEAGAGDDAPSSSGEKKRGKGRGVRGFRVFHFDQTTELVGADETAAE